MVQEPPASPDHTRNWRDRYDAARPLGVPLDPKSEPVAGVSAYPTDYDPTHLLVTDAGRLTDALGVLEAAAADFGWGLRLQNLDGTDLEPAEAVARERRARRDFDLPTVHRLLIFRQPSRDRDDEPVPPIDAWRLLQRARARAQAGQAAGTHSFGREVLDRVGLDHVLGVDPYGGKTNPYGGKTNPYGGKTNPYGGKTNGTESYADAGSGGRQVVDYVGPAPVRTLPLAPKRRGHEAGRRPTVAVLDTGCGAHPWLPDDIVTRYPEVDGKVVGIADRSTDPEVYGDVVGPYDGAIDEAAGHGTFIAGIIRQVAPEADIVSVRVADSNGTLLEGDFLLAVRTLVKMMSLPKKKGGRQIDVINLSLGYYHETPEDEYFDRTLSELLVAARARGCAVVCSAGNDATDRPAFPAALWAWKGAEFVVDDPASAAPHLSVGAINPNATMALFSNLGAWVRTYAPGASVLSTHPPFNGGAQPGVRDNRYGYRRETIDPEDFAGGFALWSGTSFAAPYVAGLLARGISAHLMDGTRCDAGARVKALRAAEKHALAELKKRGPVPA